MCSVKIIEFYHYVISSKMGANHDISYSFQPLIIGYGFFDLNDNFYFPAELSVEEVIIYTYIHTYITILLLFLVPKLIIISLSHFCVNIISGEK